MQRPSRFLSLWVRWRVYALPVMVLLAFTIPGIDQGWPRTDSHRYTAICLKMIESGEWIYPRLNDLPYFNKPPLTFWLHAAFFKLVGVEPGDFHIWAMRIPTIIAAIIGLVLTINIVRALGAGPRLAMLAGLVLATTLEYFRYTRAFSLDLWLTMWILLLLWGFLRAPRTPAFTSAAWIGWSLLAGLGVGGAFMTKPFIVLLPLGILVIWSATRRDLCALASLAFSMCVGILLAAPWHIAMALHWGEPFTSNYLFTESLDRVAGTMEERSPWWRYAATLATSYWPWLATIPVFIWIALRNRVPTHAIRAATLAILWVGTWLLILSLAGDKRGRYIIPIYPFLSILPAIVVAYALPRHTRRSGRIPMLWLGPVVLAGAIVVALLPIRWHAPLTHNWTRLIDWVEDNAPSEEVWAIETHTSTGSHPYMYRGWHLRLIGPTPEGYGSTPPDDALVYFRSHTLPYFQHLGEVVFHSGKFYLLRVDGPWVWPDDLPDPLPYQELED